MAYLAPPPYYKGKLRGDLCYICFLYSRSTLTVRVSPRCQVLVYWAAEGVAGLQPVWRTLVLSQCVRSLQFIAL